MTGYSCWILDQESGWLGVKVREGAKVEQCLNECDFPFSHLIPHYWVKCGHFVCHVTFSRNFCSLLGKRINLCFSLPSTMVVYFVGKQTGTYSMENVEYPKDWTVRGLFFHGLLLPKKATSNSYFFWLLIGSGKDSPFGKSIRSEELLDSFWQ